uniref:Uncharacterized protein n=1 Tax=Amphimedon queenslandica TaxID=400682 RepID=A0A1X7UWR5_AMPQE
MLFWIRYPHVTVGRPQILYVAAERVAGPTCSSLSRASKLSGSSLSLYRAKEWLPASRTQLEASFQGTGPLFPVGSLSYGLGEELLAKVYDQVQNNNSPSWYLRVTPDNAYRFVDRLVSSKCSYESLVKYGLDADANLLTQFKEYLAATQKKFNCLTEEQKETDMATCETNARKSAIEIVENFCAIHLEFNLRKAFLIGVKSVFESKDNKDHSREYHQVNVYVHEFHKFFGKHGGTPE